MCGFHFLEQRSHNLSIPSWRLIDCELLSLFLVLHHIPGALLADDGAMLECYKVLCNDKIQQLEYRIPRLKNPDLCNAQCAFQSAQPTETSLMQDA